MSLAGGLVDDSVEVSSAIQITIEYDFSHETHESPKITAPVSTRRSWVADGEPFVGHLTDEPYGSASL